MPDKQQDMNNSTHKNHELVWAHNKVGGHICVLLIPDMAMCMMSKVNLYLYIRESAIT